MPGVKYIILKKCLNCWRVSQEDDTSCTSCGYLFQEKASLEEVAELNERLFGNKSF